VVSFTPRPLNTRECNPRYTSNRRLSGPQSRSGRGGEEKNSSPSRESNLEHSARSIITTLTELSKVKLSLCFNWAPRHEGVLGDWRYSSTHSLTSALDEGEWSGSQPGRFTPRAVLDSVKIKIPNPSRESKSRTQIVHPVAQRYTD
jgi:hypothetical protein